MFAFLTTKVIIAIVVISAVSVTVIVLSITLPVVLTRNSSSGSTTTGATTTTATITYIVYTTYGTGGDPPIMTINSVASLTDCETQCTNNDSCYFVSYDSNICSLFGSGSAVQLGAPIQTAVKVVNGVPMTEPFVPG